MSDASPAGLMLPPKQIRSRFLVYHSKIKSSKVFVKDVTPIDTNAILIFGGQAFVTSWCMRVCNSRNFNKRKIKDGPLQAEDFG